jgi:hypothetical protein
LGIIPFVLLVLYPKKLRGLRLIAIYLLAAFFTDLILNPISKVFFNSPFIAFKFFTVIEFILVSLYLFPLIQLRIKNSIFITFASLFAVTLITENILIQSKSFDSISTGVSALSILIFSIIYLFSRVNYNSKPESFTIDGSFLVVSSIIIYFSGTFFIYILSKNNYFDENFRLSYSLINSLVLTTRNIILLTAFITELIPNWKKDTFSQTSKYSI